MLRKIISGSQTGADRAGLDFAIETGLEHGGYVPRGRKVKDGKVAERYNLVELGTSSYPARTRRNPAFTTGRWRYCAFPLIGRLMEQDPQKQPASRDWISRSAAILD
jgi:hypothetical protein